MTVTGVELNQEGQTSAAFCVWFDDESRKHDGYFPTDCLKRRNNDANHP